MQHRYADKGVMMIYASKKKRRERINRNNQQNSQNLKQLHQTLCDETKIKDRYIQRSSAAQLAPHLIQHSNRQKQQQKISTSKMAVEKKKQPVNFYINIEKLKNLKINNNKNQPNENGNIFHNPYLQKPILARRSGLLKQNVQKVGVKSSYYGSVNNRSIGRISAEYGKNKEKNARYKTHAEQIPVNHSQHTLIKQSYKSKDNYIRDKNFIDGYLRGKQLGRGGFSKVWQGFNFKCKQFFAIKQIDTTNKYQTYLTEIWFGNYFFQNGQAKAQFIHHKGIQFLLKMYEYSIVDPRAFIVFECCQGSLGSLLYDIYEQDREDQIAQDDKLYMIKYKKLYMQMQSSSKFIKKMLYSICQALDLLSNHKIVHSDIKTENILLKKNSQNSQNNMYQFKLIDYGSSFMYESLKQYKLATPEYMCPELLNYILHQNKKNCRKDMLQYVSNYQNISAIDVWGLGCIILELIHGVPLWLSNNTKIYTSGHYQTRKGLFAVSDRSFAKILDKQLEIINNFEQFLAKENNSGILIDDITKQILIGMLKPNPLKRWKPAKILQKLQKTFIY